MKVDHGAKDIEGQNLNRLIVLGRELHGGGAIGGRVIRATRETLPVKTAPDNQAIYQPGKFGLKNEPYRFSDSAKLLQSLMTRTKADQANMEKR
jgi:hypothetical protein